MGECGREGRGCSALQGQAEAGAALVAAAGPARRRLAAAGRGPAALEHSAARPRPPQAQLERLVEKNYYLHQSAREAYRWAPPGAAGSCCRWGCACRAAPSPGPPLLVAQPLMHPHDHGMHQRPTPAAAAGRAGTPPPLPRPAPQPAPQPAAAPRSGQLAAAAAAAAALCAACVAAPGLRLAADPACVCARAGPPCWPTTRTSSRTPSTCTSWTCWQSPSRSASLRRPRWGRAQQRRGDGSGRRRPPVAAGPACCQRAPAGERQRPGAAGPAARSPQALAAAACRRRRRLVAPGGPGPAPLPPMPMCRMPPSPPRHPRPRPCPPTHTSPPHMRAGQPAAGEPHQPHPQGRQDRQGHRLPQAQGRQGLGGGAALPLCAPATVSGRGWRLCS
jgi:hypothetical protein